jgi:hypothetical protein
MTNKFRDQYHGLCKVRSLVSRESKQHTSARLQGVKSEAVVLLKEIDDFVVENVLKFCEL